MIALIVDSFVFARVSTLKPRSGLSRALAVISEFGRELIINEDNPGLGLD